MSDWLSCYLGLTAAVVLFGVLLHYTGRNGGRLMGEALRSAMGLDPIKVYKPIPKAIQWIIAVPVILVWILIGLFMCSAPAAEAALESGGFVLMVAIPVIIWSWIMYKVRNRIKR